MKPNDIHLLFGYNRWANARMLEAALALSLEDFLRPIGNGNASARDLLAHIMAAEEFWLMRWKGLSPTALMEATDFPNLPSLQQRWHELEMDQTNFISKVSDESLQEVVSFETLKGKTRQYPLWQMIHHAFNHSTHHRAQFSVLLRQLGCQPPPADFIRYLDRKVSLESSPEQRQE